MTQHAIHIYIQKFLPLNLGEVSHALYLLIFPQLLVNQYQILQQNNIILYFMQFFS